MVWAIEFLLTAFWITLRMNNSDISTNFCRDIVSSMPEIDPCAVNRDVDVCGKDLSRS